jgi:hypothetical protein
MPEIPGKSKAQKHTFLISNVKMACKFLMRKVYFYYIMPEEK